MSWEGFLAFLRHRRQLVQSTAEQGEVRQSVQAAQRTLFVLRQTRPLASRKGLTKQWRKMEEYFANRAEETPSPVVRSGQSELEKSESQGIERGRAQCAEGDYDGGLTELLREYHNGNRDPALLRFAAECFEKSQRLQEGADFIASALLEHEFPVAEHATLLFTLSGWYIHLGKNTEARQALWKVQRLDPHFPGLQSRMQHLLPAQKEKPKSRYGLLLASGRLSEAQLQQATAEAQKRDEDLDQILLQDYGIEREVLGASLSAFYDVEYVAFDREIDPPFGLFEKRNLDPEFLKRYGWVPFAEEGQDIVVLMSNPYDLGRMDEIRFILGTSRIVPKVAIHADILAYIDHFFQSFGASEDIFSFDEEVVALDEDDTRLEGVEEVSEEDSEVVRLVNSLLIEAWKRQASDIHIEPDSRARSCTIRLRVDGTCHELKKVRIGLARPLVSRVKIMAHLDIAERRLPQDGKVKLKLPGMNTVVEYRVVTLPTVDGQEDVVLRVLASGKPLPLEQLGLHSNVLGAFTRMVYQPYGLLLVVGPTGSGKTTTLHSAVSYINSADRKIWTAEDPVEITQTGLRQLQVQPKIGLTFAAALRSFLRADPDVIMIGEMRDEETAHIGVEASLTGHLVFSTLHTNSAPETITRLLDMNLDPFNFADSLLCVLAQRLVKTLCPRCKQAYTPEASEIEELRAEFGTNWESAVPEEWRAQPVLYRAKGCSSCFGGYRGRTGIHELMVNTEGIKGCIKYRKPTEELRHQAVDDGMLSLKEDGLLKVIHGQTDVGQVRKAAGSS
ncbi:MAG: ATPase, T2SS/T4P/T4SS family [Thermodesulfobacteriota bacterium]